MPTDPDILLTLQAEVRRLAAALRNETGQLVDCRNELEKAQRRIEVLEAAVRRLEREPWNAEQRP